MKAVTLANNSSINSRRKLDFYATPVDVTHALMGFLDLPKQTIWEPACGDGAMSTVLESYGHKVISSDIRDSGYGIKDTDFLAESIICDAIITNPPFAISAEFISHALSQAKTVAMVFKSQYWHAKKRTPLFRDNPPAYILALNWRPDFRGGELGGSPTMEVLWTVWIEGDTDTKYRILTRSDYPEPPIKGV